MSDISLPRLAADRLQQAARVHYGLDVDVEALPSDRDQNLLLIDRSGRRFVLKIANRAASLAVLEAENEALALTAVSAMTPQLVPTVDGQAICEVDGFRLRLITHLDGRPLGGLHFQSSELLEDVGRALAEVGRALQAWDPPALRRELDWDLARSPAVIERHLPAVEPPDLQALIGETLRRYRRDTEPQLERLRKSVIHGDGNDFNLLVVAQRVSAVIDFGDMVHSHRVNDVAIAMAYAVLDKDDPVSAARDVLRGFHRATPLEEAEIAVVFNLLCMRLCVSACMAAKQQRERPDDPYMVISQPPLRRTLPRLLEIHPRLAVYLMRDACGLVPVPQHGAVVDFLRSRAASIAPLLQRPLAQCAVLALDLGVSSPLISGQPGGNVPAALGARISAVLAEAQADIGIGGYGESRMLYTSPAFLRGRLTDEQRNLHLGIDVSLPPGTALHAPLEARVHGLVNANSALDYGPMVVLSHRTDRGQVFYSLYGHLTADSLSTLRVGQTIAPGERFAAVGAAPGNGDWWPHVHVQLILDMLDVPVNFDGACLPSQASTWLSLCPDPNLLLQAPQLCVERPTQAAENDELLARRQARIGTSLRLSYAGNPLQVVRGVGQYLFDQRGRRYIDAYNNVPHVGHSHPRVVRAISEQLAVLNSNTRYLQQQLTGYAEALTACLPASLDRCFFVASGSEANELALRLARNFTGARDLLVMDAAYHGHSTTLIDISPYKHAGPGGVGAPDWVHPTPIPDLYRGEYRLDNSADERDAGERYAARVAAVIDGLGARGRALCGYIAETCPSVGGQMLLPEGYLESVYAAVRGAGGLCIADEVQTGFGRMGTHFWAFEQHAVIPDILVLGKPIGNGYPLAAVICRADIARAFDNGMEFFSTFGGSTAACAAGLATLQVVQDEGLQAHALDVGNHALQSLSELQSRHPLIGEVRGSGLFLGVELVEDRSSLAPAARQAAWIVRRMRELGVLIGTDGPLHNVLKIRGPMPIQKNDIDLLIQAFDRSLAEVADA